MSDDDRVMTDAERVAAAEDHARDCERDADIAEGQARLAEATVARLREELAATRRETLKAAARIVREQQTATMVFGADPLEHAALILDARAIDLAIDRFLAPPAATPPPAEPRRSHGPAASDVPGAIGALAVLEVGAPRNPVKP